MAFDVTGHCYYLEDGVEERNELRHNLAAHVHPMIDPVARTPTGTECDSQRCADVAPDAEKLAVPVDVTASGFYITNAYNVFEAWKHVFMSFIRVFARDCLVIEYPVRVFARDCLIIEYLVRVFARDCLIIEYPVRVFAFDLKKPFILRYIPLLIYTGRVND